MPPAKPKTPPQVVSVQPPVRNLETAAAALDQVLRQLIAEHEDLLNVATVHRAAIASADARAMSDCVNAQAAAVDRIADLERQRQAAVAMFTGQPVGLHPASLRGRAASPPGAAARVTVLELAKGLADPARSRLLAAADKLREVLNRLHQEHAAIRAAAEALSGHMEGIMRQAFRKLSHAGTYARCGNVDASVAVVTSLDVRS